MSPSHRYEALTGCTAETDWASTSGDSSSPVTPPPSYPGLSDDTPSSENVYELHNLSNEDVEAQ